MPYYAEIDGPESVNPRRSLPGALGGGGMTALKALLGVAHYQGRIESIGADLLGTPDRTPRQLDVRTCDASTLGAAIAVLANRGDGDLAYPPAYRLPHARPELLRAYTLVGDPREGHCTSGMEGSLAAPGGVN